jgi:hypothetical protein
MEFFEKEVERINKLFNYPAEQLNSVEASLIMSVSILRQSNNTSSLKNRWDLIYDLLSAYSGRD